MRPKGYIFKTIEQRFFEKISVQPNGCWNWLGFVDKAGYARLSKGSRGEPVLYVHRWSYEYYKGSIPSNLDIDHRCRNRQCVNPFHLEAVTTKENLKRSSPLYRFGTCRRGHILDEENTYWLKDGSGKWQCRQCRRERRAKAEHN